MSVCKIFLTFSPSNGYLFSLSQSRGMRTNDTPQLSAKLPEGSESTHVASASLGQLLRSITSSTKTKVLAAVLAAAGVVESADKAEAGLVVPAEVTRNGDPIQNAEDAALFQFDQVSIRTGNAEDGNMDNIDFVTFTRPNGDYSFDIAFDFSSDEEFSGNPFYYPVDVAQTVLSPNDAAEDDIVSEHLMYVGRIPTFQDSRVAVGGASPLHQSPGLFNTLEGTTVRLGIGGDFEGDPLTATTPEELIQMYSGRILESIMPNNINVDDAYILHSATVSVPEPSSAAYLGAAGVAAGAAALRRRKRRAS